MSLASKLELTLDIAERGVGSKNPAAVAHSCRAFATAESLYRIVPVNAETLKSRNRTRRLMSDLGATVSELNPRRLDEKILADLAAHPSSVVSDIARRIRARTIEAEDARVEFLHALGRNVVLSWPPYHADGDVLACLKTLRSNGLVKRRWTLFLGNVWSAANQRLQQVSPDAITIA